MNTDGYWQNGLWCEPDATGQVMCSEQSQWDVNLNETGESAPSGWGIPIYIAIGVGIWIWLSRRSAKKKGTG